MKALVNNHIIIKIICHIRVYNLLLGKLHLYDLSSYTWLLVSSFHKIVGFLSPIFVHCKKNNGFLIYFMIYLSIMQNADLCSCHHLLHDKHCCCFYYHLFFFSSPATLCCESWMFYILLILFICCSFFASIIVPQQNALTVSINLCGIFAGGIKWVTILYYWFVIVLCLMLCWNNINAVNFFNDQSISMWLHRSKQWGI